MQLQLKIQLQGITKPPVWRKIRVPGSYSLHQLHEVIQVAFGWGNYHLYQFSEKGYLSRERYGILDEIDYTDPELKDSLTISCEAIFTHIGQKYTYIYDFGDDWTHKITIEDIIDAKTICPELISGKGACPPEDCGGPQGYARILEILHNPKDSEYNDIREWLGAEEDTDGWDVNYFDLKETQKEVAAV